MAHHLPDKDAGRTQGRKENTATPLGEPGSSVTPEDYPKAGKGDAGSRSFDPRRNPQPRQGAGDGSADPNDLAGPAGDTAEGRR